MAASSNFSFIRREGENSEQIIAAELGYGYFVLNNIALGASISYQRFAGQNNTNVKIFGRGYVIKKIILGFGYEPDNLASFLRFRNRVRGLC